MEWEIKSLDDNFEVIDFEPLKKIALVGYKDNKESIIYIKVDNESLIRSDADNESEEELTFEDLRSDKFDKIPSEIVEKFLEENDNNDNDTFQITRF